MATITPFSGELPTSRLEPRPSSPAPSAPGPASEVSGAPDFARSLEAAVSQVDALQLEADAESSRLAEGGGNLHETMLALEKADVAMRLALKVRNRVVDAYAEIMRMPV